MELGEASSCMPRSRTATAWRPHPKASSHQHGMINLPRCVAQCGLQVLRFQIGEIGQDLLAALPSGKERKDVLHTDPHTADAGPAATLIWVVGDAAAHGSRLSASAGQVPIRFKTCHEQLPTDTAAKLCDASAAPLRAGDALHLAVCRRVSGQVRCCRGVQIRLSGDGSASPDLF